MSCLMHKMFWKEERLVKWLFIWFGTGKVQRAMGFCHFLSIRLSSARGAQKNETINIGAIIDVDSRAGKEQQIAMKTAVQSFNSISTNHGLAIHFRNIGNNPIQAVSVG